MHRMLNRLRTWIEALTAAPAAPDPLDVLDMRHRADLPTASCRP